MLFIYLHLTTMQWIPELKQYSLGTSTTTNTTTTRDSNDAREDTEIQQQNKELLQTVAKLKANEKVQDQKIEEQQRTITQLQKEVEQGHEAIKVLQTQVQQLFERIC